MRTKERTLDQSNLTFLIIAQNEEANIADAIRSCEGLGRILVVDGGSADSTPALARDLGARLEYRPFSYSAAQYNFGLNLIDTEWTFVLDADERIGRRLRDAIAQTQPNDHVDAYWVARRNYFVGKPIRFSNWSPDLNMRLLRTKVARYEDRPVHARVHVPQSRAGRLDGLIHHLTYNSIEQYITKLNRLTSREVEARRAPQRALDFRSQARTVFLTLPAKPLVRWLHMYVIKRGFLDGKRGLALATLSAIYEYVVSTKQGFPPDTAKGPFN